MIKTAKSVLFLLVLGSNILSAEMDWLPGVYATKPLLIPLLAWGLVGSAWGRVKWVWIALFFSWVGDVLLMLPYNLFVFGLASFLLAHIFYIRHFWGEWDRQQVPFHWSTTGGVVVYLVAFLLFLYPVLGALKIPVILYGFVISTMLLLALHTRRSGYAFGAALFVLSDSLLAINKFHTQFPFAALLVMSTYGLAQFYLVKESSRKV